MSNRLRGKTILITGGSAGIGRSTALEFARTCPTDLKIIITGRRKQPLDEVAAEIMNEVGAGVKVLPIVLDVSDFSAIAGFVASLPEEWREIDVLVNNAGLARGVERAPDIAVEDMNLTFDTNIIGLIHMTQAVLPRMLTKGESGQGDIICLGSIAGQDPYPGGSIYCATKSAIRSFSEALRKELIATRIRVMQIDPGQVETVSSVLVNEEAALMVLGVFNRTFPRRQGQSRRSIRVR
jgi:3-hydroxy acid dehydrogenase/malonic semialdehyde reductase